ncbi:MAG: caspase family protein, partial [Burkholderiaceae bacterium]|nr:caspase family protein [Burkholderiaceae bacterium]
MHAAALTRRRLLAAAMAAPVAVLPAWAANTAGPKAALVIGNANYKVGSLKNPLNDAQAVASSLRKLGFEVAEHIDTTQAQLIDAFLQFSRRAQQAAVRVVYYAGHGVQVKGRNYLLPVDTEVRTEDDIPTKSADLSEFIERLSALKRGMNIVILDACRNNPFSGRPIVDADGRLVKIRGAATSGLARTEAPLGSMVVFSTAPDGIALDNSKERHSLYTKHLLKHLDSPGLPVELLFKRVRIAVAQETGGIQVPWESSSLTGEFCFKTGPAG